MENEEARKKLSRLHIAIPIKAGNGLVESALEDAKEKLKIMKSIRIEMVRYLPGALMDCCELAALCKLPRSNALKLMKKAKEMSELQGDLFVYNYVKKENTIERIRCEDN